ncbi:hypothetical protein [Spirosoma flavum]|uniref:Uncharacterized protein n=1 Tax=Spirosoma flavum TaxID=2048557 RepID=A0ABW6AQG9_9BACT
MNRFSVIYLLKQQYQHIYCATHAEAESIMERMLTQKGHTPIGIYDAKTELFYWEPKRQDQYNHARIEEQGQLGDQITTIAQTLRNQDEAWQHPANSISQLLSINP